MKWYHKVSENKWIETDSANSFWDIDDNYWVCDLITIVACILFLLYPLDVFQFLLNLFINWPIKFLSNPTVEHFLDGIGSIIS